MSVCGPTEEDSASEEVGAAVRDKTDIYKQKPTSKLVRVLTVLAYLLSVSLVAILLSVYYTCVWKSPELRLSSPPEPWARRGNLSDYGYVDPSFHDIGGGNTTVSDSIIHSPLNNNSVSRKANMSEPAVNLIQETTSVLDITPVEHINETTNNTGSFNITDNIT